jgi:porphobilinogen synthase
MNNNSLKLSHYLHSSQSHPVLREWQSRGTTHFSANDFVLPLFIINSDDESVAIESLPNNSRMGVNVCLNYLRPLVEDFDLKSVLLFPVIDEKQIVYAFDEKRNPVLRLIPKLKKEFPKLLILVDVCLCTFSPEGHCCVFDANGNLDNSSSIEKIAAIATKYAEVGADVITPSDMMDTRISFIRNALRYNHFDNVSILSYSAKFESCFYGPFRDAAGILLINTIVCRN